MRQGTNRNPEWYIMVMAAVVVLAVILIAERAFGEPWLVVKPDPAAEWYEMGGLPAGINASHLLPLNTLKLKGCTVGVDCMPIIDLAGLPLSVTVNATVRACKSSPATSNWPEVCSDAVPFDFTPQPRPASTQGIGVKR